MSDDDALGELIERYLHEPDSDPAELARRLRADPQARRRFVHTARFEAALRRSSRLEGSPRPQAATPLPRLRLLLAALLLFGAGLGLGWWWQRPPPPPYRVAAGEVQPVHDHEELRDDTPLEVVGEEQALLMLPDGSEAELAPGTRLKLHRSREEGRPRQRILLQRGRGTFTVVPGRRSFLVQTGAGTVTVLGTAFTVATEAEAMSVRVHEGRVRVDHAGGSSLLVAGDHQRFDEAGRSQRSRRGRLLIVDREAGSITLAGGKGGHPLRHPLHPRLAIDTDDDLPLERSLQPGALVELQFDADNRVDTLNILQPELKVILLAVDVARRRLTVVETDEDTPPDTYPLAPDAVLLHGRRPIGIDDLRPDMRLRITLRSDWSAITACQIR